ncbi:hypothetical protein Tco_0976417 [Tanacetum coccineum]|uniref:Uncharacterized protein n=1 Tax=Tanacetum coccineum TaxID=301880 RepID=A0ABQ5EH75_9ASTR
MSLFNYLPHQLDSRLDPLYTSKVDSEINQVLFDVQHYILLNYSVCQRGNEYAIASTSLKGLPRGIIEAKSDLELKPLWSTSSSKSKLSNMTNSYVLKGEDSSTHNLLAVPVGLKQKRNVNTIVRKPFQFLTENFTVILFHYDGKVDGWRDLEWNNKVIHIVAQNQTKCCSAIQALSMI